MENHKPGARGPYFIIPSYRKPDDFPTGVMSTLNRSFDPGNVGTQLKRHYK